MSKESEGKIAGNIYFQKIGRAGFNGENVSLDLSLATRLPQTFQIQK